ncbi:hypothetical protein WN51_09920 [Melipona quadrifasciata]|uniref:Uncharacterized protein n=1 Tax=Melipona quadrifasciata TaxID=166423 RepID=A0A0M9A801_9HYME|nr:hypothetical protein WN51_09920 [Melipona quadrifasciata]
MVWKCIGAKEQYLCILYDHAIPSGRRLIGKNFIFMRDNDPKHTARVCKNYLQHLDKVMHQK